MQITKSRIRFLLTTVLIVVGVLVWACDATADVYTDSAHGNNVEGVNRSSVDHPTGDCVHCHETFDNPVCDLYDFMLFYDDLAAYQTFCTTCHGPSSTWQPVVNYPYAKNFGGSTQSWYPNIYIQFADSNSLPAVCGSRHHLGQIRTGLLSQVGQDWGFNDDPNPCVACHAPHASQRNHPVADVTGGGELNTAIRRPSHYDSTSPQDVLWGDDANERMSYYASSVGGTYQSPYYTSGTYEPSGNMSPSDGSDLPDYVTFCMDCHKYEQYNPDTGENVKAIVWDYSHGPYPDIHGAALANTVDAGDLYTGCMTTESSLKAPYVDFPSSNYVLSCLDCHEPHGTYRRLHLVRLRINGETVGPDSPETACNMDWSNICERCHNLNHGEPSYCVGCHGSQLAGFHGSVFDCAYGIFGDCAPSNLDGCPRAF